MADTIARRGRPRASRFTIRGVMGAVLAVALLLAVPMPPVNFSLPPGFPRVASWAHGLQVLGAWADWLAHIGAIAGAIVLGRCLFGGAAPSRAEWLAIVLAVFASVEANARLGDALDRAITAVTNGWVEATGLILPAFSQASVGMLVTLACLLAIRGAGQGTGSPSRWRAPLAALLLAAMLWGPLPALGNWARWSIDGWPAQVDLGRLGTRLLYALAVVAAARDFARPRPEGPRRRLTEWAALGSWLLLALAWTCGACSRMLSQAQMSLSNGSPPALSRPAIVEFAWPWAANLASRLSAVVAALSAIVEASGPPTVDLILWLAAAAVSYAALRLGEAIAARSRPDTAPARPANP